MNYIGCIVKILETPKRTIFDINIPLTKIQAQLPELYSTKIVTLNFWGNLSLNSGNYYKANDYVIIEGYLSIRDKSKLNLKNPFYKNVEITVTKFSLFIAN